VHLLDFGIALVQQDADAHLTAPASALGTAAYMSPEQAQGLRATAASDVYALGGVLVAMLSGRPPYPGENPLQVARMHITQPPVSVRARMPQVSPALDDLVRRMLDKDPATRPPAAIVARALAQWGEDPQVARTAILPAVSASLSAAAPAATAVIPSSPSADEPAGVPPASARRHRIEADAVGAAPSGRTSGFLRTAGLWIGVVIAAVVVFYASWLVGSTVFAGSAAPAVPASASPEPDATPQATPTPTPTPTPEPTPT
ncbi:MAG: protein kinase, partial [Propionibacteriaceae bacterium]|nr:protein kinase [Propionibacteriaceae bacterium]